MADNAADVAEDYRQALEDLTVNSRIEIATLTNIARENANHGFAIAEVLQNHIKKVCFRGGDPWRPMVWTTRPA
jgi:pre-mRNA cleavage complex 2 protein Pcf11